MTNFRPRWAWRDVFVVCLCLCISLLISAVAGAAPSRHVRSTNGARHSRAVAVPSAKPPRKLMIASRRARHADSVLVADAKHLRRCLRAHPVHPRRCNGERHALQQAGTRLANAERALAQLARAGKTGASDSATTASTSGNPLLAPTLTVSGETLEWNSVDGIDTYVFVRKVPGEADQYSVVSGTSVTPPPVPGETVRYSVRTTASSSAWATEVSISYPPASQPPSPPPSPPDEQAAPALSVSGQTLTWNAVAGVSTYVFVRKVPGQADQYSEVSGTSVTPPAVPGATVRYSVRTAVQGSAWAPEVSISYPSTTTPPPPPPPPPPPNIPPPPPVEQPLETNSGMMVGLDTGGWNAESSVNDFSGAVKFIRSAYTNYDDDTHMGYLAKDGVKLLPLFGEGGSLSEYDNGGFANEIVTWFKRYGYGGTFWAGRPVDLGATTCELLNEPRLLSGYSNQLYAEITKLVYAALEANFAPSVRPKLLVSNDGGVFQAHVGAVADGVVTHAYGGSSGQDGGADGDRQEIESDRAASGLPVYVTEVGWPTAVGQPPTGDSQQWTEAQQAENIVNFIRWARSKGYVDDVTIFNYVDYGTNDYYGIERKGGAHKLSFQALKEA